MGRLTRDPESKTISDIAKTSFTIAIDRPYKKEDGTSDTDFFNIVTWGKVAELTAKFLRKGTPVLVDGRIQIRPYEKDSQKRWFTEMVADNFQLLDTLERKSENKEK
jgi:single-strand DNA-binding protein